MKKLLFLAILAIESSVIYAQVINTGQMVVNGNYLVISSLDFNNKSGATLDHKDGTIYFTGDNWTNNGTITITQQTSSSNAETHFKGSADQTIGGSNENFFNKLYIDQPSSSTSSVIQNTNITTNDLTVNGNSGTFEFKVKDPGNSGLRLTVKNNLTLNGNLRLYDDSQLLQTATTAPSGSGKLYRDQMGMGNKYWYDYWCSPVNNGGSWTLSSLMDGRNPDNPQSITFEYDWSVNGSANVNSSQNPAHLNEAFIFKFEDGPIDDYNYWQYIGSSNGISPGVGYTMKGPDINNASRPGSSTTNQFKAYTFAGTPNNGTYTFTIGGGHDYLIGNPYPSALDADAFIDNNTDTNGTLYFWDHTGGTNHLLQGYVGGYATYTLSGGVAAKDWQTNTNTVGTKTPKRYIPVGQGFFVQRDASGNGTITIQNSQRAYVKEDGTNSNFFRSTNTDIRLSFVDPDGLERELLLAVRPGKSLGYDWGYDGPSIEEAYSDMYFDINGRDFVIQATDQIGGNILIPLHVVTQQDGQVGFGINSLLNVPSNMHIYIYDSANNVTYEIAPGAPQSIQLAAGDYTDRFYLAFRPADQLSADNETSLDLTTSYANGVIRIQNPQGYYLDNIHVYAINGKEIIGKNIQSKEHFIQIPASLTPGVYIYKLTAGDATKAGKFLVE